MNTEDFVTYEQAFALSKLGFNEETFTYYDKDNPKLQGLDDYYEYHLDNHTYFDQSASAPTLSQAQKWLRKIKKLFVEVEIDVTNTEKDIFFWTIYSLPNKEQNYIMKYYDSYEEALSDGITECLKLLKINYKNN